MKVKQTIKLQEVKKHLESWGSIDRLTAATRYKAFDLPDVIRQLRAKNMQIETLPDYNGNTKYQLLTHPKHLKANDGDLNG